MSSGVDSGGIVAAAVMLPVGVAFGAGWLAWQGGKLLVEANRAADRQIEKKRQQLEETEMRRKLSALATHNQLVDVCTQLLSQIESNSVSASVTDFTELERLKVDLKKICHENVPDAVVQLESQNQIGFLKLDRALAKQQHLASLELEESGYNYYRGHSLADLMDDIRMCILASTIQVTNVSDVKVADHVVLERAKLNAKLGEITVKIMDALENTSKVATSYGLSTSSDTWLKSCFNGVDEQIKILYMPTTSNSEIRKGIKKLEEKIEQYEMLMPTIENEQRKFIALYQVYVDASKALGESIASLDSFNNINALEDNLFFLKKRSEQAQECAKIYNKLGPTAYICYAWDQELRALGYSVHTRKDIAEMTRNEPQNAQIGEIKLPYYNWNNNDLTQLYSMAIKCSLQVIVHDDGSVTMQAISDPDGAEQAKQIQAGHCELLQKLHENLKKKWFVLYEYKETSSSDIITSAKEWFGFDESAWKTDKTDYITKQRKTKKGEHERSNLSKGESK